MRLVSNIAIIFVALLHIGFAWLEMIAWTTPVGRDVFNMSPDEAAITAQLALNQGFYNLMLAVALLSAMSYKGRNTVRVILMIIIAVGIFGGITVSQTILAVQAAPAIMAWALTVVMKMQEKDSA